MSNIKSARECVKAVAIKTLQNKAVNFALKTEIKKASPALEAQAEDEVEAVRIVIKEID